jgi:hypothetical protein
VAIFYKVIDTIKNMILEQLFISPVLLLLLLLILIWDTIWKGIALWKSGRNNQLTWFVCILIFNTAGILPIIYLCCFQKKSKRRK